MGKKKEELYQADLDLCNDVVQRFNIYERINYYEYS